MDAEQADQRSLIADLKQLYSFIDPFKWQAVRVLALITTVNLLAASSQWLVGWGFNEFLGKNAVGAEAAMFVFAVAGAFAVLGLARALLLRAREPVAMRLAMDLLRWLRVKLYGKVQALSFTYLDRLSTGQIIERATGDLNMIRGFLTQACLQAFDAVIMAVVVIVIMITMNWQLALVALAPFPVICFLWARWAGRLRRLRRKVREEVDVMTTRLAEGIAGVKVIRSFGRHGAEAERYQGVINEVYNRVKPTINIRAFKIVGVYSIARAWVAVLLVVGGWMVMEGRFEVGYLFTFMVYSSQLLWRAQALMMLGEHTQDARTALERVMALLEARPDVEDEPDARDLPQGKGEVTFENVTFAYVEPPHPEADVVERMDLTQPRKGPDAVHNVSLVVEAGERIALVGPTGAGKSTIISLLPRFYDPTYGRVLIDGQEVKHTRLESLRREIGIVFQETFLFRGTIAENIAYGRPEATREEIMAAARLAQADEFIGNLRLGYDSEIGERGVSLSGGQRQRLAIARAILKQPRLLILDDAMAAVDANTELKIRKQLDGLMRGRTTFIIAHRLATVRSADRVVVMNDGRVEDVGKHEELVGRNEFYRQLCESQLQGPAAGDPSILDGEPGGVA